VNETVPQDQWVYWDVGFLVWGAVMLIAGWYLKRAGRADTASAMSTADRRKADSYPRTGRPKESPGP